MHLPCKRDKVDELASGWRGVASFLFRNSTGLSPRAQMRLASSIWISKKRVIPLFLREDREIGGGNNQWREGEGLDHRGGGKTQQTECITMPVWAMLLGSRGFIKY